MTTTEQVPAGRAPVERPSRLRGAITAAAVALVIAAGGGAVVYATSGNASSSSIGQAPAGMGQPPVGGDGDSLGGATHGELQTGTVTAITDTSVTAESTDGYRKTYVIDADTVFAGAADITEGDTITVVATISGDTATAVQVSETA